MKKDFRLYVGLSPYNWHRVKSGKDTDLTYYPKFIELLRSVLFTYYNIDDFLNWLGFMESRVTKMNVILDSGAFSLWRLGGTINVDEYTDFALKLQDEQLFNSLVFVCLDKIPGTIKRAATTAEVEEAAKISLRNYKRMKAAGVENVLPVYHLGEELSCLKEIADAGAGYIGLGGLARGAGSTARRNWLERVFSYLKHYPEVRTHGFGVTASKLVIDYPWYSVDSVTPFMEAGYGNVSVFNKKARKMTRKYIGGLVNRGGLTKNEKRFLEKRFGAPFDHLNTCECRRYFSIKEWLKFEAFVRQQRNLKLKKTFQKSLLGAIK